MAVERSEGTIEASEHQPADKISSLTLDILKMLSGTLPLRGFKTLTPFVNSLVMARISSDARAAATMINALESLCSIVFNAPAYYIPTAVGKVISGEQFEKVGREAQAAWIVAAQFAAPQIILLGLTGPLFKLLGQSESVTQIASNYFQIYAFSIVALSLQSASDQIAQTAGHIYSPAVVNGIGLGLLVFLSVGLGLGKFGLPNHGVQGVAFACIARAVFNLLAYTGYSAILSHYNEDVKEFKLFKTHSNYWASIKPQLLNGIILLIAMSSLVGGQFLISSIVGRLGPTALSSELVISQWQEFLLIPAVSIGAAGQMAIAKVIKSKPQNIFSYGNIAVALSLIAPLAYNVITFARPRWLIEPFLNPNIPGNLPIIETLETKRLLFINGINMLLNTVQMTLGTILMGVDRVLIPMVLGIISNWLVMGLAWGLAKNVQQLNLFVGLGYGLSALVIGTYWVYLWKTDNLVTRRPAELKAIGSAQAEKAPLVTASVKNNVPALFADNDNQNSFANLAAQTGFFASPGVMQGEDEGLVPVAKQNRFQGCALL